MYFHPRNRYHWDFWMIQRDDEVHSFYLSRPRPMAEDDPDGIDWLGHAVSRDLYTWQELAPAVPPGPAGSLDDMKLWTGHIIEKDGTYYLYYTGRSRREDGRVQRTMLATSTDLTTWEKHPDPVMAPDARWYLSEENPDREGNVGWRDPVIVLDETTGWYHGYLAAYTREGGYAERGCVAHVRSRDLVSWETLAPVFTPGKYATIEVPDVFRLDGKWHLTLLTGSAYGNRRGSMPDPRANMGTIYAVSDSLDGPFVEPEGNLLIGSKWWEATSLRSVEFNGTRYVFHFSSERIGDTDAGRATWGCLAPPKRLVADAQGLRAVYVPLPDYELGRELVAHPHALSDDVAEDFGEAAWTSTDTGLGADVSPGWAALVGGPTMGNVMVEAVVTAETARAIGVLVHAPHTHTGLCVLLDLQAQEIRLTRPRIWDDLQSRGVALRAGQSYTIRVIARAPFYEVYLDDVFVLSAARYERTDGRLGFVVDGGSGHLQALKAHALTS